MTDVGPEQLGLSLRGLVADQIGDRLAGRLVEVGRHLAELQVEVDDEDTARTGLGVGHRDVDRDRGRPDPALGAVHGDQPARPIGQAATDRRHGDHPARALEAQQEGLDAGLELAVVERLGHDVVGARLQEPDALLDVVVGRHAEHRDRGEAGRAPDLAADVGAAWSPWR